MKLLLSSFGPSPTHDAAFVGLVGKPLGEIRVAYIENAYDVYDDQASLDEGRESLRRDPFPFRVPAAAQGPRLAREKGGATISRPTTRSTSLHLLAHRPMSPVRS